MIPVDPLFYVPNSILPRRVVLFVDTRLCFGVLPFNQSLILT